MKVLIAAAIFGISCGIYGCSNEAKVAGRPTADAVAEVMTPAVVVNPPAVAPAGWVDVTTVGPNLTLKDTRTGLQWSNKRPDTNWSAAKDHCNTLNYNGVTGWRLPTKDEFVAAYTNGIYSAARTNWMTKADMDNYFWSASNEPNTFSSAERVNLGGGWSNGYPKENGWAVVCVHSAVVNPPAVVNPAAPAGWVDVTTVGPNLTLQDTSTGLKWSNRRPDATQQGAIDHCNTLTYNGVTGWRLLTKDELVAAHRNGIYSAARTNWMTKADMDNYFWSVSSYSDFSAWVVYLGFGNTIYVTQYTTNVFRNNHAVVCVW